MDTHLKKTSDEIKDDLLADVFCFASLCTCGFHKEPRASGRRLLVLVVSAAGLGAAVGLLLGGVAHFFLDVAPTVDSGDYAEHEQVFQAFLGLVIGIVAISLRKSSFTGVMGMLTVFLVATLLGSVSLAIARNVFLSLACVGLVGALGTGAIVALRKKEGARYRDVVRDSGAGKATLGFLLCALLTLTWALLAYAINRTDASVEDGVTVIPPPPIDAGAQLRFFFVIGIAVMLVPIAGMVYTMTLGGIGGANAYGRFPNLSTIIAQPFTDRAVHFEHVKQGWAAADHAVLALEWLSDRIQRERTGHHQVVGN